MKQIFHLINCGVRNAFHKIKDFLIIEYLFSQKPILLSQGECYPQGGYPPLKNTKESTDSDEDSDYTEQDRMDCYNNPTNEKVIKSMQHSLKELRKIEARSKQIGRPTASTEAEINSTLKSIEELKGKLRHQ